jgi:hypothetical protein
MQRLYAGSCKIIIKSIGKLSFPQAKRACLSLPTGRQAVDRSGILLKTRKDSGQAGMTNVFIFINFIVT